MSALVDLGARSPKPCGGAAHGGFRGDRRHLRFARGRARRPVHRAEGRDHRRPPLRRQARSPPAPPARWSRATVERPARPGRRHDAGARTTSAAPSRARAAGADLRRHRLGRQDRHQGGPVRRARPRRAGPRPPLGQELQQPYRRAAVPRADAARRALRRVRDGHEPCRRARRADPAGPAARRHRHRHRLRPPRSSSPARRRSPTPRARSSGARAGRHRDHPVRQPAPRPADRRRAAARGTDPHLRPRRGRRRPRDRCRPGARRRLAGHGDACPEASSASRIAQPGEHWVSNALAVLAAVEAVGGDLAAAGLALADLGGLKGRGERRRDAGRRRRGAADRRELQCQSGLDGGDPEGARRARRSPAAASPCSARCASWARADDFHAALAEPVAAAGVDYAILVGEEMAPLAKALGRDIKMAHVPDTAAAIDSRARGDRAGRRDTRQGIQFDRTCRPRRGAGGREELMFLWIAEQLGFPGVFNLFRYITFRAGAATATALLIGLMIGPKFIGWLRVRQGKGQPIRDDGPADPPRQARHADHGRADDPDLADRGDAAVDGLLQPLSLGVPVHHRRLRPDRLPRRLRQGEEAQPQGRFGPGAAARRVRRRRHRLLGSSPGAPAPSSTFPSTTGR